MEKNYEVAIISDQIQQNYRAWAKTVDYFSSREEAEAFASRKWDEDWDNVPEGCSLGYSYIVLPFEDEEEEKGSDYIIFKSIEQAKTNLKGFKPDLKMYNQRLIESLEGFNVYYIGCYNNQSVYVIA